MIVGISLVHDFSWVNIDYGQPSLEPWMKQFNRTFHTFYTVFIKIHKMTHLVGSKSMTILFYLLHVNGPHTGITSENSQVFLCLLKTLLRIQFYIQA